MAHPADRLLERRFGIFNHFLYGDPGEGGETDLVDYDWDARVAALDVDYIARQLHQMGAGYYCITLLQGKKYTIAPNAAFDRIAGTRPGEACARRDLVADLYEALRPYDIDLLLYYTGDGPYQDPVLGPRFGFVPPRKNVSDAFVAKWAAVLEEYALRYGDRVKGWWVDGCFDHFGYNDRNLQPYYDAIKRGNPTAVTAFNNGVAPDGVKKWFHAEEITAGEFNEFSYIPRERFVDGAQVHILAPLGLAPDGKPWNRWCRSGCSYTHEQMRDYIRAVNAVGGTVTVDIRIDRDGRYDPAQVACMTMTDL